MHLFSLILLIPSLSLLFFVYAYLSCYMLCLVVSSVCFFVTPWTVACQALLPMGMAEPGGLLSMGLHRVGHD